MPEDMLTVAQVVTLFQTSKYDLKKRRSRGQRPFYTLNDDGSYLYNRQDVEALFAKR